MVKLVQDYYLEHGHPPSMRYIARALRISTKTLYRAFPGGAEEVYRAAGVGGGELPDSYEEFVRLYREYLRLSGLPDSAATLSGFVSEVLEYVRGRLGRAAAEGLARKPLSVFNKIARIYLRARSRGEGR